MCCIFTCCGWMIDLFQRAWVFAMSCCISSAVCCFMLTASMSGVALGYNYSLAEYIELKETNVSVFLKRGVFDDEVVDEMDWRRGGGGLPSAERSGEQSSEAPSSVSDFPFRYRKANDEGMFGTTQLNSPNDLYGVDPEHNRFEGSLMKLTLKPKNVAGDQVTQDFQMEKIMTAYPPNSIEQLKAIQGLMNRRRMEGISAIPGGNIASMMPNPIMSYSVSFPVSELGTASPWGVSDELKLIQRLLDERKEDAKKFDHMKKTSRKTTSRPLITGEIPEVFPAIMAGPSPARRMGNPGARVQTDIGQMMEDGIRSMIKEPSKWYQLKAPEVPVPIWTPKEPVTIHNFVPRTKLKPEDITPLSQESFRRAMQEASIKKDDSRKEKVQSMFATEPATEPQKDYDEEDVKGIPIRRKRKKRNRRSIPDSRTEVTEPMTKQEPATNIVLFGNRNSMFNKLMAVLMNFKSVFATESAGAKVLPETRSSAISSTVPVSSDVSNTDIVASSYINVGASSIDTLRTIRLIKSTVATF